MCDAYLLSIKCCNLWSIGGKVKVGDCLPAIEGPDCCSTQKGAAAAVAAVAAAAAGAAGTHDDAGKANGVSCQGARSMLQGEGCTACVQGSTPFPASLACEVMSHCRLAV